MTPAPKLTPAAALRYAANFFGSSPTVWHASIGPSALYDVLHAVAPGASTTLAFAALRATALGTPEPGDLGSYLAKLNAAQVAGLCLVASRYADAASS